MKKALRLVILLTIFSSFSLFAQEKPVTIILLRHAEKLAEGKDPDLSVKGIEFAKQLAKIFSETKIDAAYTTNYNRTKQTILPLAEQNHLKFILYDPSKTDQLVKMLDMNAGKTVLIVCHSNTINLVHNALFKNEQMQALGDDEYRKIFIVTYYPGDPSMSTSVKMDLN